MGTKGVQDRLLQKSQPFWKLLMCVVVDHPRADHVAAAVRRRTPPSGMCVLDLQGTQGSFSFYSTKTRPAGARTSAASIYQDPPRGQRDLVSLRARPGRTGR